MSDRISYLNVVQFARLEHACSVVMNGLGHRPYLVGSATERPDFRDVDLRVILPDDEFDRLFVSLGDVGFPGGLWGLLCLSVGQYLSDMTGLPIDFQIQRTTEANEKFGGKPRNPMGNGFRYFADGGDTPWKAATGRGGGRTVSEQTDAGDDHHKFAIAYEQGWTEGRAERTWNG